MDAETLKLLGSLSFNGALLAAVVVLWREIRDMRKEARTDNRELVDRYHNTLLEHVKTLTQILDVNRELAEELSRREKSGS